MEFAHEEWNGDGYCIKRPYAETERRTPGGPIEYRHHMSDIFNGLTTLGMSIQCVEDDPHYLHPNSEAAPGSWEHTLAYLVGFAIVARKGP